MRKNLIILAAAALFAPLSASATNLVTNGSFETGTFADWTLIGVVSDIYPAVVITYGSSADYPTSAFGEVVTAPASGGSYGAYFVSDSSSQTLTQTITVTTAGNYQIGFSAYAPTNGLKNPVNAAFTGSIAGNTLLTGTIGSNFTSSTGWKTFSSDTYLNAGNYVVSFAFSTPGTGGAKDVVIDNVYVMAAAPVPEPETYALMMSGLALVAFVARRRQDKQA